MMEDDAAPAAGAGFGTVAKSEVEAANALLPKSHSELVQKVRESISAGTGGLGLSTSIAKMFSPPDTDELKRGTGVSIVVPEGSSYEASIAGVMTVFSPTSGGEQGELHAVVMPTKIILNGKIVNDKDLELAKDAAAEDNSFMRMIAPSTYKNFGCVVRATVTNTGGTIKVMINGISAR